MIEARFARFGGLAALAVTVVSFTLNGSVPGNNSTGAEAAAWFDDHTARHVLAAWSGGIAALALAGFFFAVRNRLEGHGQRNLVRASSSLSLVVITLLILGNVPIMAGAMTANDRDLPLQPAAAEVFLHLGIGFYLMMVIALSGYLTVTGMAMIRAASLPNSLGYLSLAGAAAALLPYLGFLGFAVVLPLWTIATTVWLHSDDSNVDDQLPRVGRTQQTRLRRVALLVRAARQPGDSARDLTARARSPGIRQRSLLGKPARDRPLRSRQS
jgi:hypothetical protein